MRDVGERWGYRQKIGNLGEALRPVEIVRLGPKLSNKVRVRWLAGEFEGLDEWSPTVRLLVPWDEAEAFIADEQRELALDASQPERVDDVRARAVDRLSRALRSELVFFEVRRNWPLWAMVTHFDANDDRRGTLYVGQEMVLRLTEAFCMTESQPSSAMVTRRWTAECRRERVVDAPQSRRPALLRSDESGGWQQSVAPRPPRSSVA